jgi:hypothetical protein
VDCTQPEEGIRAAYWYWYVLGRYLGDVRVSGSSRTRSTKYVVSIYRKTATARLDAFVGPKDRAIPLRPEAYPPRLLPVISS